MIRGARPRGRLTGPTRRTLATAAAGLLLATPMALLAGCSSDEGGSGPDVERVSDRSGPDGDADGGVHRGDEPPAPDRQPEPAAREEPPEEFSRESFRVPSKSEGKLSDLEVGQADEQGVETVTFDLGTEKLPPYHVGYVDQVRAHPEGEPIAVDGEAYLEVGFELTDPNDQGRLAIPPDTHPDQSLVQQTLLVRNVGGELRFAIGLSEKAKFRARQDGTSLVVELRTG